jgi:2-succinyl-5-enolpyruvyl-6-hydroxy-3-cyclohexene-1-carboxylate synthase
MSDRRSIAACNLTAARALVDAWARCGVRYAVLAPGSRSGPLAVAIDEREDLSSFVVVDERSAAFFALGIARYSEMPAVVLCTSGTAGSNFHPAVAEASVAGVPMIVVTADRPPEARGFGAAQTIRQVGLFDRHVRDSLDVAVPSTDGPPSQYYAAVGARSVAVATGAMRGPVHLNVPFREPLLDVPTPTRRQGAEPGIRAITGELMLATPRIDELALRMRAARRGLFVCGPSSRPRTTGPALWTLATRMGWPVLADPLSGLRTAGASDLPLIEPHDAILRAPAFRARQRPDLVLRFGALPTSQPLRSALAEWRSEQILITPTQEWPDPEWTATDVVVCEPAATALALAARIDEARTAHDEPAGGAADWLRPWHDAAIAARGVLESRALDDSTPLEAGIALRLIRSMPADALLVVGNSMPIRDLDAFCTRIPQTVTILGNRGANGIDGLVSTALGAAAAARKPTVLLLGDLAFLHDVGALHLAARLRLPLLVVVVNNDGGGIFHALPCAGLGETFERVFATPHGLELSPAAALGGIAALKIARVSDIERVVAGWTARPEPMLLETPVDRAEAARERARVLAEAAAAVEASGNAST